MGVAGVAVVCGELEVVQGPAGRRAVNRDDMRDGRLPSGRRRAIDPSRAASHLTSAYRDAVDLDRKLSRLLRAGVQTGDQREGWMQLGKLREAGSCNAHQARRGNLRRLDYF